jgi:hypothetical protein
MISAKSTTEKIANDYPMFLLENCWIALPSVLFLPLFVTLATMATADTGVSELQYRITKE